MKDWYLKLKLEYQVSFWSLIILSTLTICLIPCYFFKLMEIPNGILLGGLVGTFTYLLLGLFSKKDEEHKTVVITVILMIVRFLLIAGTMFLVGYLYYSKNMKAFNIFAVAGGYLLTIIIHIIVYGKEKVDGHNC